MRRKSQIEKDMKQLIMYPNSDKAKLIKAKYKLRYELEKVRFFGTSKDPAVS